MANDKLRLITEMNHNTDINETLWTIRDKADSLTPSVSTFVMLEDAKKNKESIYVIVAPPKFETSIPKFKVKSNE